MMEMTVGVKDTILYNSHTGIKKTEYIIDTFCFLKHRHTVPNSVYQIWIGVFCINRSN